MIYSLGFMKVINSFSKFPMELSVKAKWFLKTKMALLKEVNKIYKLLIISVVRGVNPNYLTAMASNLPCNIFYMALNANYLTVSKFYLPYTVNYWAVMIFNLLVW